MASILEANADVAVVAFDEAVADPALLDGPSRTIWYLGADYARLLTLKDKFGTRATFAPAGDAINAAAHSLLPLILNLDGALAVKGFDREAWDASDLADRSRYNAPFFLELCRLQAFLAGSRQPGHHIAITDDSGFALAVFDALASNGRAPSWLGPPRTPTNARIRISRALLSARRLLGDVRAATYRSRTLRHLRALSPLDPARIQKVDVWIVVWATPTTFAPGVDLRREDRVGRLPSILRAHGLHVGYIVLPLWPECFGEIAQAALKCAEPVVFVEDGASLLDAVAAVCGVLRPLKGVEPRLVWDSFDLSAVLGRALAHERTTGRPMIARLLRGVPRLLERLGANPAAIVTTYENHNWEKTLTGESRKRLKSTRILGYNHSPFSSLYVSLNPSPGDIAAGTIPDCVLSLGRIAADNLVGRGFPPGRVAVVGGLRYEEFVARARRFAPPDKGAVRKILCCVGVDLNEAIELVHKAAQAVALAKDVSLVVNFHPMSGGEFRGKLKAMLLERGTPGFESIAFDDRPVRDLVSGMWAVLYIDSNAALEAAAAGRRIIYVKREAGLDYDKMPDGLARRCRTPAEIVEALDADPPDPALVESILHRLVAPVDEKAIVASVRARVAA